MKNKMLLGIIMFCGLFFFHPARIQALNLRAGQDITLTPQDTIEGALVVTGSNININTNIAGDVFCMGQNVIIRGNVAGDVICLAQSLTIDGGVVDGAVRSATQLLNLNSTVGGNITAVAQTALFSPTSSVSGEVSLAAGDARLDGTILGLMSGNFKNLNINGSLHRNTSVVAQNLTFGPGAQIENNFMYTSDNEASQANGRFAGKLERRIPDKKISNNSEKSNSKAWKGVIMIGKFVAIGANLIMGVLLLALLPRFSSKVLAVMEKKTGSTILWGFFSTIVFPIALVMLFFTLIGIPFALLGFLMFMILMGVGRIYTALLVGTRILNLDTQVQGGKMYGALVLGVILMWLAFSIPFFGWLISAVSLWLGFGGIIRVIAKR